MRDSLNTFSAGRQAARAVSVAVLNGWHNGAADIDAARSWADHLVPNGIPGTAWRRGFRAGLDGQRLAHLAAV